MADADDVRRIALGLPEVVEIDSEGFDFRVSGKGFVWSYPERFPGRKRVIRTDVAVLFVGDEAEKQALVLGEPDLFFTTPAYDSWPLVMLRLEEVGVRRLGELITDAWAMRAGDDFGWAARSTVLTTSPNRQEPCHGQDRVELLHLARRGRRVARQVALPLLRRRDG